MPNCCQIRTKYNANYLKLLNNSQKPLFQPLPENHYIPKLIIETQDLSKKLNKLDKCTSCGTYFDDLYQQKELKSLEKYYNITLVYE